MKPEHVAAWATDTTIRDAQPNDIKAFVQTHGIEEIWFNGQKSAEAFRQANKEWLETRGAFSYETDKRTQGAFKAYTKFSGDAESNCIHISVNPSTSATGTKLSYLQKKAQWFSQSPTTRFVFVVGKATLRYIDMYSHTHTLAHMFMSHVRSHCIVRMECEQ